VGGHNFHPLPSHICTITGRITMVDIGIITTSSVTTFIIMGIRSWLFGRTLHGHGALDVRDNV
jgi:hypothetical protein